MEQLLSFDQDLLLLLNGAHTPFLDSCMWWISAKWTWIPLYLLMVYYFLQNGKKSGLWTLLFAILSIVLADQFASSVCKPIFERPRPSQTPILQDILHYVNGYRGGRYGFISSHAANAFAIAIFAGRYTRNTILLIVLLSWALLLSYSRVYLGVHYPGDVFFGALAGIIAGSTMLCALNKVVNSQQFINSDLSYSKWIFQKIHPHALSISILLILIGIVGYSLALFL